RFFLQSDIDEFSRHELMIDDYIRTRDLAFFDLTYKRLMDRIQQSKAYYSDILSKPIDYSVKEEINTDYDKLPYAKTTDELREKWRKQIKLSTLSSLADKLDLQEGKKDPKPKSGDKKQAEADKKLEAQNKKDSVKIEKKPFAELEKETRE